MTGDEIDRQAPVPIEEGHESGPAWGCGSVKPHRYQPSWIHMGDCAVCGHLADSPLHVEPPGPGGACSTSEPPDQGSAGLPMAQ